MIAALLAPGVHSPYGVVMDLQQRTRVLIAALAAGVIAGIFVWIIG